MTIKLSHFISWGFLPSHERNSLRYMSFLCALERGPGPLSNALSNDIYLKQLHVEDGKKPQGYSASERVTPSV